jgi:hypothetical protein
MYSIYKAAAENNALKGRAAESIREMEGLIIAA